MLDASAFVGPWAFTDGQGETLGALARALAATGIAGAAISPARAVLAPEPMAANRQLLATLRRWDGARFHFWPVPIIDPLLPSWREHLAECCARGGGVIRAVKIVPNYHCYALEDPAMDALAAELVRRDLVLCVQARMVDERAQHPLMMAPGVEPARVARLAATHPKLAVVVCGPYLAELAALALQPNIHAELSFVESGYLLRDALAHFGVDRLLLGTHAPLHYPAPAVAKLRSDDLPAATLWQLGEGNLRRVFGLDGGGSSAAGSGVGSDS